MLYRFFIGSDNQTKRLNKKVIMATALQFYPNGFTYYETSGVWNGGSEKTAIVEVLSKNKSKTLKLARELKKLLHQDAILLQEVKTEANFI